MHLAAQQVAELEAWRDHRRRCLDRRDAHGHLWRYHITSPFGMMSLAS